MCLYVFWEYNIPPWLFKNGFILGKNHVVEKGQSYAQCSLRHYFSTMLARAQWEDSCWRDFWISDNTVTLIILLLGSDQNFSHSLVYMPVPQNSRNGMIRLCTQNCSYLGEGLEHIWTCDPLSSKTTIRDFSHIKFCSFHAHL